MKRVLAVLVMVWCVPAQQEIRVTYQSDQASVQFIVMSLAQQAGLGYNWQKSHDQTDPQCRRFVQDVRLDSVPFEAAMHQVLDAVGLWYTVEQGEVVLYRTTQPSEVPIHYSSGTKSIQYIVIDLAKQAGLGYNWGKSYAQTDPECRRFVNGVSLRGLPFDKAMDKILGPVGLAYQVEDGQVVLYRK